MQTAVNKGSHTVTIQGRFAGAALAPFLGGYDFFAFEDTYTVIVS